MSLDEAFFDELFSVLSIENKKSYPVFLQTISLFDICGMPCYNDNIRANIAQIFEGMVVIIFREKYKKIISTLVLGTFALSISSMAFADIKQAASYSEGANEILVIKQENVSIGDWVYKRVMDAASLRAGAEPITAVFDGDSGLYKATSEENLYLAPASDTAFQPMEKSIIYSVSDLRLVSEQYHLTEIESKDIASFMGQCPGNPVYVCANEAIGEYNGKTCRLVCVSAADNYSRYEIRKGLNAVVHTVSALETKANIGCAITKAVFDLLGINFSFRSDSSSIATKDEWVTFQYLDFYERGSAYVTRGITSYGTITLTTSTTCWVKLPNGVFVNDPIIESVGGSFGSSETLASLAAKSVPYFERYGSALYKNYTTKFAIDKFNSIPAIQPKR